MTRPKDLQSLTLLQLREALEEGGTRLDRPLLLSFDCDDTIADRARGPHFITSEVIEMFERLRGDSRVRVAINTGRDALSYLPIERQIGPVENCLFVAGRVLRRGDQTSLLPNARLSQRLIARVWELFDGQVIPYIDVKDDRGFFYIARRSQGAEKYFGHDRPPDWFAGLEKPVYYLEERSDIREILMSAKVVRLEVPLLCQRHPELAAEIGRKDLMGSSGKLRELFGAELDGAMFLPAPTSQRQDRSLQSIGSLRVLCDSKLANKGTALGHLARLLEIPETNVLSFGDSSSPVASDSAVADHMPRARLFIAANGDERARASAHFIVPPVGENGAVAAVAKLQKLLH